MVKNVLTLTNELVAVLAGEVLDSGGTGVRLALRLALDIREKEVNRQNALVDAATVRERTVENAA